MRQTTALTAGLCASALLWGQALAQVPADAKAADGSMCKPTTQVVRTAVRAGGGAPAPAEPPAPRNLAVTAIPGVVAAGGGWTKVWQQGGNSADGVLPDKDGNLLFAQEDYDNVLRLDRNDKLSVAMSGLGGVSSLGMDRQGRLYGVHRTEWVESTKPNKAAIVNAISILGPGARRVLADKWEDGTPLTIRPNDFAADSQGGGYFTTGCLYYAGPKGVAVVADNLRTNGVVFSPDDKTLYVTNGPTVVAFDVKGPGVLANRRDFARLEAGGAGDGLAVDAEARLYVTSGPGVQVFDKAGKYLGLIPTPRAVISIAFAGPDKGTLYVVGGGADDEAGRPIRTGPQSTAASLYKLPMLARGLKDRAK
ncbi:MAG TPA: SMP-30/gluconolactonase/LRE family protein [Caulobacteraceae bacterium]|nr:SMP-30/gluconolactonase/LRE family protein [Caulobacteraceae bacterium]